MNCALWLNRRKIYTAAGIADNLDVASLRGYLLAGTLIDWLNEHGGKRYAAKLQKLSPDDEKLNEKIAAIFGAKPANFKALNGGSSNEADYPAAQNLGSLSLLSSYPIGSAGSYNYAALSSFGSFFPNSFFFGGSSLNNVGSYTFGSNITWEQWLGLLFGQGSFSLTSYLFGSGGSSQWEWLYRLLFGYGSFSANSFSFGSFHEWEWEWLYRLLFGYGSFSANSFTLGSFSQWEWLYKLLFGYGSFSANSFAFGSFSQWEWLYKLLFGYGSFSANSFTLGSFGSFCGIGLPLPLPIDEYDLILLKTLANCPLDRFGYGIHNI